MSAVKAVFDTNILISARVSIHGNPFRCIALAKLGQVQSVTCQPILGEFARKLVVKFQFAAEAAQADAAEVTATCSVLVGIRTSRSFARLISSRAWKSGAGDRLPREQLNEASRQLVSLPSSCRFVPGFAPSENLERLPALAATRVVVEDELAHGDDLCGAVESKSAWLFNVFSG